MATPIEYNPEIADEIVRDIALGITLSEICRRPHMPHRQRIYEWMEIEPEFSGRIAQARELGFDVLAEECLDIAEDGSNDYMERMGKDGKKEIAFDREHVQRSKLRVETRLKLLAKWSPKKYGDRQQVATTDVEGNDTELAPILFVPVSPKVVE